LIKQLFYVVEVVTRPRTKIPSVDLKRRRGFRTARGQPNAQRLVHRFFERAARSTHFGFKLGADILVESQSGSHIMMLSSKHHDV